MARTPLSGPFYPFLGKGGFKALVLQTLQARPMHGYEVMKVLEERFQGFYKPSPGAVYPALQSLRRQGYVTVSTGERRKTYRITRAGRAFLRKQRVEIERRFHSFEATVGSERASLFREIRATGKLLRANLRDVTPDQAAELEGIVVEMRERMVKVLAK